MTQANQAAVRIGLLGGLALIVYGIAFRLTGLTFQSPLGWVFYLGVATVAWVAIRKLTAMDAAAGFKTEFSVGSYAAIIASLLYAISVYGYNALVDASLLTQVEEYLRQTAIEQGKTGAALEQANQVAKVFTQPFLFVIAVFLQLAITGISSAASFAAWNRFRSKKRPPAVAIMAS